MKSPVFICGTGRSGTTILYRLLAKHPDFFSLRWEGRFIATKNGLISFLKTSDPGSFLESFESRILGDWYKKIYKKGTTEEYVGGLCANIPNSEDLEALLERYRDSFLNAASDRQERIRTIRTFIEDLYRIAMGAAPRDRWIEKTPHNILYIKELIEIFPGARVINVFRDGRDVAASIRYRGFWPIGDNEHFLSQKGIRERTMKNCARYWRDILTHAFKQSEEVCSNSCMHLKMEELLSDPQTKLREICKFIGEPYREEMMAVNLDNHNIGRWVEEFSEQDKLDFKKEAGDLLIDLGYAKNDEW